MGNCFYKNSVHSDDGNNITALNINDLNGLCGECKAKELLKFKQKAIDNSMAVIRGEL